MRTQTPRSGMIVLEGPRYSREARQWLVELLLNVRFRDMPSLTTYDDDFVAMEWVFHKYSAPGAGMTATLPAPTENGTECSFKEYGGGTNVLTIAAPTGWTVEGAASITRNTAGQYTRLVADTIEKGWHVC